MTQKIINIGTVANDGTGDTLRGAFANTNNNFTDLYVLVNSAFGYANAIALSNGNPIPAFDQANTAFNKANAANVLAFNTGVGANAWANSIVADACNYVITIATDINTNVSTLASAANIASRVYANGVANSANANAFTLYISALQNANNDANSSNIYGMVYANGVANGVNTTLYVYANNIGNNSNTWANNNFYTISNGSASFATANAARERPVNAPGAVTYVLTLSDAGKTIAANSTILIPNAVFYSGNVVHLYNNTAAAAGISITPNSSVTLIFAANSFGTRTLSANGYATLACIFGRGTGQNVFSLSGTTIT